MSKKTPDFEENLVHLEKIIASLEQKPDNLSNNLADFEKGIKIINSCQKILGDAEKKVQILLKENDKLALKNFSDSQDD